MGEKSAGRKVPACVQPPSGRKGDCPRAVGRMPSDWRCPPAVGRMPSGTRQTTAGRKVPACVEPPASSWAHARGQLDACPRAPDRQPRAERCLHASNLLRAEKETVHGRSDALPRTGPCMRPTARGHLTGARGRLGACLRAAVGATAGDLEIIAVFPL